MAQGAVGLIIICRSGRLYLRCMPIWFVGDEAAGKILDIDLASVLWVVNGLTMKRSELQA
jgi:hypothetical protein